MKMCAVAGDDRGLTEEEEDGISRLCSTRSDPPVSSSGPLASSEGQPDPTTTAHSVDNTRAAQLFKMNLGPACLLGSHCIVLVHHYLDTLVHCCPGKLWRGAGEAVAKVSKQRQRRTKRRKNQQRVVDGEVENTGPDPELAQGQATDCTICGQRFDSRNKLFKHINVSSSACRRREGEATLAASSSLAMREGRALAGAELAGV